MHARHPGGSSRHGTARFRWKLTSETSKVSVANADTKPRIRDLFHGHVGSGSTGRGPLTTLWSALDHEYAELMQEEAAEPEESPQEPITTLTTLTTHFFAISRDPGFPATQHGIRQRMPLLPKESRM